MTERATALTREQNLRAAVSHVCNGTKYEVIAELLGVNHGRVAEACLVLRLVAEDPKKARKVLEASNQYEELK